MPAPLRLQRKRTPGARLPAGAVCCTRPGLWSNPFVHAEPLEAVRAYWRLLHESSPAFRMGPESGLRFAPRPNARTLAPGYMQLVHTEGVSVLRGRDLACYCSLCPKHSQGKPLDVECLSCKPCHVDVLGRVANGFRCDPY